MCSLMVDPMKGMPQVGSLSWIQIERKLSGLDNTMVLDEPIMRLRALPSGMLCNVCPSLSGSDQP